MDKICIDRLEVFAYHGVLDSEKASGQNFYVSAQLYLDLAPAGDSDDLALTVNYAEVCSAIVDTMQNRRYDLIETCAVKVGEHILHSFPLVRMIKLRIDKPSAPIPHKFDSFSAEVMRKWSVAYLGLGSNIGNGEGNLDRAIQQIQNNNLRICKVSPYYTTNPVSDIVQNDYTNAAVKIETTLSPLQLMEHLLAVESRLGRVREERWGPRVIDIDLLMYENVISDDSRVIIPHPLMHKRMFVLQPLSDIAPHAVHPRYMKTVEEMMSELATENKKE